MGALQAHVVLQLGDSSYTFALRCRELENLEKAVSATVADIATRVISFRPSILDIKHIILLGLEGGGTPPEMALSIYDRYVAGRPLMQRGDPASPGILAARIMEAAWFGVEDIDPGKENAGAPSEPGPPAATE